MTQQECPVCIGMMNQVAHNPDSAAFEQASIEIELHPNHRRGALVWANANPEYTKRVLTDEEMTL